ncbi:hypothetical protein FRC04_010569 [Tulasnella sp. 424]|nr:hypothetical protein FRC04_010569 [Tulasnella sp. 424]KAG8972305.1 hypothetical protein FRC05_010147 [Tulasnella sp. 425]
MSAKTAATLLYRSKIVSRISLSSTSSSKLPIRRYSQAVRTPSLPKSLKPATHGQPTHRTHPHLLKANEITPGITKNEYMQRRKKLMDNLSDDNAVVVCLAGNVKYASGGFNEPESALILEKTPSTPKGHKSTLFLRPKNPRQELWDGTRTGVDAAPEFLGVDQVLPITELPTYLQSVLAETEGDLYTSGPQQDSGKYKSKRRTWSNIFKPAGLGSSGPTTYDSVMSEVYAKRPRSVRQLAPVVLEMRSVKSEAEQRVMKLAGQLSGTAHAKTMKFTEPGRSEADLAAHFEYICALGGAERPAYVPVVASGSNALMIHYTANNQVMEEGEMVLMDAGCELHGYASDITRTWPVSGTFTQPQKDLYTAVLNTLKTCTEMCTEENGVSLFDLHRQSVETLREELKQIGFGSGSAFGLTLGDMDRLYPHFVSHAIGVDLHESGEMRARKLEDGMVVTIEPGIYVPPDPMFPKAFHNMGIRLEDDILVKRNHAVRLTANAPLEIADVEGTCQGLLGVGPY